MDFVVQELNTRKQPASRPPPPQYSPNNYANNTTPMSNPKTFSHSPQQPQKGFMPKQQNSNYKGPPPPQYENPRGFPPQRQPNQLQKQYPKPPTYNHNPRFPPPVSNPNTYQNQNNNKYQPQTQPQYQRKPYQSRGNYQGYQGGRTNYNNDRDNSSPYQNEQQSNRSDSRSPNNNFNTRGNIRGRGMRGRGGRPYQQHQQNNYQQQLKQFVQQNFANHPYVRNMNNQRGRGRGGKPPQTRYVQKPKPNRTNNDEQMKNRRQKFSSNYSKKPYQIPQKLQQSFIKKDQQSQSYQKAQNQQSQRQESYYSNQNSNEDLSQDQYDDDEIDQQQREKGSKSYDDQLEEHGSGQQEQSDEEQLDQEEGGIQQEDQQRDSVNISQEEKAKLNKIRSPQKAMKKLPSFIATSSSSRCIDEMCSKEEYDDRLQTFNSNNRESDRNKLKLDTSRSFSVFQISKKTMRPDYELALKRFRRSADRAQEGVVQDTRDLRRSIKALNKVIIHIGKYILDADHMNKKDLEFPLPPGENLFQFIHIYDFLWDRMRQMIKDITRLSQKQQITKEIITISEQIARFFILGINQGRKKYTSRLQFDQKMNRQSIVKILTILKQFYHNSRMQLKKIILQNGFSGENTKPGQIQKLMRQHNIYISPNEPQIISYVFLFSNDRKKQFYEILSVGESSKNPLFQSQQIQKALQVHKFLNQKNYQQYFKYLQSQSIDYAMSCLMLHHLNTVRKEAVKVIFKTQICQNSKNSIFTQELRQVLRFKDKQQKQFQVFLSFLDIERKNDMIICNDPQFQDSVKVYKTPEYIFDINKLERKLFTTKNSSKPIINRNQISREEIVTRSWKTSTYDKQIIAFYLGTSYDPSLYVDVNNISQSPQRNDLQQQASEQEQPIIKRKTTKQNKNLPSKKDLNLDQISVPNKLQQKSIMMSQLQKTRQNMRNNKKNKKRAEFLLKFEEQIKQLFRQTDKGKQLKQKKSIAVMDQWIMYYHDKMLKTALDKIHYEFRKKILITGVFEEMLAYTQKRKNFFSKINRCPYEMDPEIYVYQWRRQQVLPLQRDQKETKLMSKMLKKLDAQIQIPICYNFEQSLNSYKIQNVPNTVYKIFIISTISSSNIQCAKVLINLIKYFISKSQQLSKPDLSRAMSMVEKINNDKKMTVFQQSFFINQYKTQIRVKLVKILDINNNSNKGKKTNLSNSTLNMKKNEPLLGYYHLIPHFFGCHSAIILRQNSKPQSINPILKIFEDFQNTNSRAQIISDRLQEPKLKIMYKKLKFNQLPLLLINVIRSSIGQNKVKPLPKSQELDKMSNVDQITVSDLIQAKDVSYFLRNSLKCSLQKSVLYDLSSPMKQFLHEENTMKVKSLDFMLRQIKINAVNVQQKMRQYYGDLPQNLQKINTFVFYQQYFNMCIEHLLKSIFWCFDNCKYQPKWSAYLDQLQHRQQIQMDQQTSINLISQTYYEMEFMQSICQKMKMNFVGPDAQKLDKDYLYDTFNHHFQKSSNTSNAQKYNEKNDRKKMTSYEAMQNLVRFHQMLRMITDYINQFAAIKTTFNQKKTQALISIFGNYDLRIRVYESRRKLKINGVQQQEFEYLQNSQLMGNSLELFNFILTCLIQNVSFINVIVPINFKFSVDSQQFMKRVQLQIGKQVRRKQHPFGIAPEHSGRQNLIQKLVKTYNQTHQPIPLPTKAGPYLPQIEYIQPQMKRHRNYQLYEEHGSYKKTQKIPSIQKITFQKQLQRQQAFLHLQDKKISRKKLHQNSFPIIDVDQLCHNQEKAKIKSIQKLYNSYRGHNQYVKLNKVLIDAKRKNPNTQYQKTFQKKSIFKTQDQEDQGDYIRKDLMDTIRKKLKLNNC